MFVRKFQADSLEEALKEIKQELGPDAIVLKTVTNKGLKGAFKKSRIEITAAIPENKLKDKMIVDQALGEKKDDFYQNKPSYISNMISNYAQHSKEGSKPQAPAPQTNGYGNLGLNKAAVMKQNQDAPSGLDSFLNNGNTKQEEPKVQERVTKSNLGHIVLETPQEQEKVVELKKPEPQAEPMRPTSTNTPEVSKTEYNDQQKRIDELENKLSMMMNQMEKLNRPEPAGLFQLRTTLRSLDVNEQFVSNLIRKISFEYKEDELKNDELIFEFALREMLAAINTEMPLFSTLDSDKEAVITVLISESSSGQSATAMKLGALKKNSVVIKNIEPTEGPKKSAAEKLLGIEVINVASIPEIISEARRAFEEGRSVFIDYKNFKSEINETKKFVEGLRRAFDNVEVLISLSSIHQELYNRKVLSTYGALADGLVFSHLDLCLNFGAIFNVLEGEGKLPAKFFGTGPVIPDDIETASAERVLDSIFKFE